MGSIPQMFENLVDDFDDDDIEWDRDSQKMF